MDFGPLLKSLRLARGFTQEQLAQAAGLSTQSIQRQELSKRTELRRSNIVRVYQALAARAPLSQEEGRAYFESAGLMPMIDAAAPAYEAVKRLAQTAAASTDPRARVADDVDAQSAIDILIDLIEERGPKNVLAAMEGMCAAWGIDPRPRRTNDRAGSTPRWALVSQHEIEDRRVTVYSPLPVPPAKEKAARTRRGSA